MIKKYKIKKAAKTETDVKKQSEDGKIKINKKQTKTERVVIIGGGFAGVRAALDLLKKIKNIRITIIEKNPYHSYHPDYYEIASAITEKDEAGGYKQTYEQTIEIYKMAAILYEKIFAKNIKSGKINIVQDKAEKIDFKDSFVDTTNNGRFAYDWLIASAGSKTRFYGISGLKDISYELKSPRDALNIRSAIHELFASKPKHKDIKIIIGGGGFTGCETAAELCGFADKLRKIHSRPKEKAEIVIIEASSDLINGASAWVSKKTHERLKKLGARIITNSPIEKVESVKEIKDENSRTGKIYLKNGGEESFDILIWTAGVEAADLSNIFPENSDARKSCLKTNENLLVPPYKNVFAAGDIAYCEDPLTKNPLPMTAQTAISEGARVALAITKLINGKRPPAYKPILNKFIIPLGGKYALADLGFIKISGFPAWVLKRLVTLKYFLSILPFFTALNLWLLGLKIYTKND